MPPSTPRTIRYRGRDDHPLRLALLDAWGWCCYWQPRHALIPSGAEIDHIIPDSTSDHQLAELITLYDLPADFDLQSPRNLAPICGPCNIEKSNTNFLDAPIVVAKLRTAARYEDQVLRQVEDYYRAGAVAHHLVAAAAADLSQPEARGEFLQFAPAIVQTLPRLDESAADFETTRLLHVDLAGGLWPIWVRLDTRGGRRRASSRTSADALLPRPGTHRTRGVCCWSPPELDGAVRRTGGAHQRHHRVHGTPLIQTRPWIRA